MFTENQLHHYDHNKTTRLKIQELALTVISSIKGYTQISTIVTTEVIL